MTGEIGSAFVRVRANTTGLKGEVNKGVTSAFSGVRGLIGGAFAATGIFAAVKGIVGAASEAESALTSLRSVLENTTGAGEEGVKKVAQRLEDMGLRLGFSDELLTEAFIRIQAGTKNTERSFDVLNSALDVARARKLGVTQAALVLGRAVQGSVTGLGRLGIILDKNTKSADKNITATNVLAEIQKRFGGAAERAAQTASGAADRMRERFDELQEDLGNLLLPVLVQLGGIATGLFEKAQSWGPAFKPLQDALAVLRQVLAPVVEGLRGFFGLIEENAALAAFLKGAIGGVVAGLVAYKTATLAAAAATAIFNATQRANPIGLTIVLLAALAGALITLHQKHEGFRNAVNGVWADVRRSVDEFVTDVRAFWKEWGDEITAVTKVAMDFVRETVENGLRVVRGIFQVVGGLLQGDWGKVWEGLQNIAGGQLDQLNNLFKRQGAALGAAARGMGTAIVDGFVLGIGGLVNSLVEGIAELADMAAGAAVDAYDWGRNLAVELARGFYEGLPTTWLGEKIGSFLHDVVELGDKLTGSTLAEFAAARLGGGLAEGMAAGLRAAEPTLAAQLGAVLNSTVQKLEFKEAITDRIQRQIDALDLSAAGASLADQLQEQIDKLKFSPLAKQIASFDAAAAAEKINEEREALTAAIEKARDDYYKAIAKPLPADLAGLQDVLKQRDEIRAAIREAEEALAQFEREQANARSKTSLENKRSSLEAQIEAQRAADRIADISRQAQRDALSAQLAAQQALDQARLATVDARNAAADAANDLTRAVTDANRIMVESMLSAQQNLSSIAGQLSSTVGAAFDAMLQKQLEALSHSPVAREISRIDKQLREAGEREARESAKRAIAEAKRGVTDARRDVSDAKRDLARLLAEGPRKGTKTREGESIREKAFERVVFPGEPGAKESTEGGESEAEFARRVADARRAIRDAEQSEKDARQRVVDAERRQRELRIQQRRDELRRELEAQRRNLQEQERRHKESVQRRITDLTELFNKDQLGLGEFNRRIEKLLGGAVTTYRAIAKNLGLAVAHQFWAELQTLGLQAAEVARGQKLTPRQAAWRDVGTIVRPLEDVRKAIQAVGEAQKRADATALALEWKKYYEQVAIRKASQATAAALTAGRGKSANDTVKGGRR